MALRLSRISAGKIIRNMTRSLQWLKDRSLASGRHQPNQQYLLYLFKQVRIQRRPATAHQRRMLQQRPPRKPNWEVMEVSAPRDGCDPRARGPGSVQTFVLSFYRRR